MALLAPISTKCDAAGRGAVRRGGGEAIRRHGLSHPQPLSGPLCGPEPPPIRFSCRTPGLRRTHLCEVAVDGNSDLARGASSPESHPCEGPLMAHCVRCRISAIGSNVGRRSPSGRAPEAATLETDSGMTLRPAGPTFMRNSGRPTSDRPRALPSSREVVASQTHSRHVAQRERPRCPPAGSSGSQAGAQDALEDWVRLGVGDLADLYALLRSDPSRRSAGRLHVVWGHTRFGPSSAQVRSNPASLGRCRPRFPPGSRSFLQGGDQSWAASDRSLTEHRKTWSEANHSCSKTGLVDRILILTRTGATCKAPCHGVLFSGPEARGHLWGPDLRRGSEEVILGPESEKRCNFHGGRRWT